MKFKEAKEALHSIAKMNNIKSYSTLFVFDAELIHEDQLDTIIEKRKHELVDKVYNNPSTIETLNLQEL